MYLKPIAVFLFGAVASFQFSTLPKARKLLPSPSQEKDGKSGGHKASIKDHPYQVALFERSVYKFVCGGFIVSASYILSAAHCTNGKHFELGFARAGSSWRENGTIISIAEVIPHPYHKNFDCDVGVIRTLEPIRFTGTIQAIRLPSKQKPLEEGSKVSISGWGYTDPYHKVPPDHLMAMQIPVVSFFKCWTIYPKIVTRNMWCGGNLETGHKGSCRGDSGGPAVQDGIVVGIASWGPRGCVVPGYPSGFVDIAAPKIRDFIRKHTGL